MVVLVLRGPVLGRPVLLMRVGPGPVLLMLGTVMALVSLTALLIHE
jgi:hypothetical protein